MARNDVPREQDSIVAELDRYLIDSSVTKTLLFWAANKENHPRLHRLHLKHHIPATSAAMERCFGANQMLEGMIVQSAKCNKEFL